MIEEKSYPRVIFIHALAFFSGFVTLLLEIAGSRVIAPYYGTGLTVWTAAISMTIISLSLGWFIGGYLTDRKDPLKLSLFAFMIAGIWMSVLPWISQKFLEASLALPPTYGAVISFFVITGPVLICMGVLGPATLKLITTHLNVLGLSAGKIYILSSLGSVIGSWVTGFYLLPELGVVNTIFTGSVILYSMCLIGFLLHRQLFKSLLVVVAIISATMSQRSTIEDFLSPVSVIELDGLHGKIHLTENFGRKRIYINGILQGQAPFDNMPLEPTDLLKAGDLVELIPYLHPGLEDLMIIGVGAGTHGVLLSEDPYNLNVTYVDIDESLVNLVNDSIHKLPPTVIGDGRQVLQSTNKKYDAIVLDAFAGESAPIHMCSTEFFQLVQKRLKPEGIFSLHHIGDANGLATSSLHKTLSQTFKHVHVLNGGGVGRIRMLYFFASNQDLGVEQLVNLSMKHILGRGVIFDVDTTQGEIFTDDKCRFDEMQLSDMQLWRQMTRAQILE